MNITIDETYHNNLIALMLTLINEKDFIKLDRELAIAYSYKILGYIEAGHDLGILNDELYVALVKAYKE